MLACNVYLMHACLGTGTLVKAWRKLRKVCETKATVLTTKKHTLSISNHTYAIHFQRPQQHANYEAGQHAVYTYVAIVYACEAIMEICSTLRPYLANENM